MKCKLHGCQNKIEGKRKYCSSECIAMSRLKTITQWQNSIWKLYSSIIMLMYADDNGYVRCFTCNEVLPKNSPQMHAGHYEHGKNPNTWLNYKNVHPQCAGCNTYRDGNRNVYARKLEAKYGFGILQELGNMKHKEPIVWNIPMLKKKWLELRATKEKLSNLTD